MKNITQNLLLEKKWIIEGIWMAAIVFFANIVSFLISKEYFESSNLIKITILSLISGVFWGYIARWRALKISKKKQEE